MCFLMVAAVILQGDCCEGEPISPGLCVGGWGEVIPVPFLEEGIGWVGFLLHNVVAVSGVNT